MPLDFSGQNLRGRSFKGQDLTGADFSGADIRGTDFSGANLTGTDFTDAEAGLQSQWAIFLMLVSWILMGLSGLLSAFAGTIVVSLVFFKNGNDPITYQITSLTIIVILVIFFFVTIRQGIQRSLATFAVAFAVAFAIAGAFVVTRAIIRMYEVFYVIPKAIIGAFRVALTIAFTIAFAIAGVYSLAQARAGSIAVIRTIDGFSVDSYVTKATDGSSEYLYVIRARNGFVENMFGSMISGIASGINISLGAGVASIGATIGTIIVMKVFYEGVIPDKVFWKAIAIAGVLAVALVLLSTYICRRALKGDSKYTLIRNIAIAFAAFKGTSFRSADLTDANFTASSLESTDFRKANLNRTCFHKTKKLDRVRPGSTYLQKVKICQVLVTGLGQDQNFDRFDLRGVNFTGANLKDASFISTNLNEANLQDANLSRAKLVQAQLDGTDFTGATLTGAYIKDWNITSDTKFEGVRCQYVYMRLPTKEDPNPIRKPDNTEEVFAHGEFGDFIKPIVDTLDLYHNQGIDPRAIAIAFKELAENNPEAELEIVAIERRGEDKILLRAKTVATANKSELSKEYFINYNHLKALAEQDFKALIIDKESQILRLENMIMTTLERPSFYAENYHNQGDTIMPEGSKKQSTFNLKNAQFGGGLVDAETVNADQIGGNIINYAEKQNLTEAAAEIQQLLTQLQNQGYSQEQAQQQVAQDLAKKADNDPTVLGKLVKWGQSLGNTAANTTVTEAAKEVFKIALRLSGIPIP